MYEHKEERETLFSHTGKYTELKLLNEEPTGFGWAVLVQDNYENNRPKVIKLPNREAATRELLNEAEILARISQYLRHPNLIELGSVECYRIPWRDDEQQRWFIVLQYGGKNLRSRLGRLGVQSRDGREEYVYLHGTPLSLDEALDLAIQVTDGLRALHEFEETPGQHIVHRDIKPENILIDDAGRARLTDFGISKVVERLTQSVTVAGTLPYLAPEYSTGRLTAASDIYSLGIVIYEMLTGRFPFQQFEDRFYTQPPSPHEVNSQVPEYLSEVVMKTLAYDRSRPREEEADRYHRAADLLADLKRCKSRMHPVPRQYQKVTGKQAAKETSGGRLYYNTDAGEDVRIFLIESERPLVCLGRLDTVQRIDVSGVIPIQDTFHTEEMVGIAAALRPGTKIPALQTTRVMETIASGTAEEADESSAAGAVTPETRSPATGQPLQGEAAYEYLRKFQELCELVGRLHELGTYHGFLTPQSAALHEGCWFIDHAWLGALVGAANASSVLVQSGVNAGDLAPEVLRWDTTPQLSSDIYGLAGILYSRFAGESPLEDEAARELACGSGQVPAFRAGARIREKAAGVPRKVHRVIVKALQLDPAARHQSLGEFIDDLNQCRWPGDMVESLIEVALDYQTQGKAVEAYDTLDQALIYEPGSPGVHHARARIYLLEGEYAWAVKENQIALDIEPTGENCSLHAQALLAMGETEQAVRYARRAVRLDDSVATHHILARCLEKAGEPQEAMSEYEQAYEMAQLEHSPGTQPECIQSEMSALSSKLKESGEL